MKTDKGMDESDEVLPAGGGNWISNNECRISNLSRRVTGVEIECRIPNANKERASVERDKE
jgi:hypothetical protein